METFLRRRTEMDDVEQSLFGELSSTEKYLIKSQELMWIRGKRGKRVPVLIPVDAMEALKYVSDPEVTSGDGVISASKCISDLAGTADLIHPDRLTSTGYRAYMATISQCLGLQDHQIQWLFTHLGHTENVHKTHYRFALGGVERIQLGKLLLIQDRNLLSKYKDKKLEDIEFEEILCSEEANTGNGVCSKETGIGNVALDPDAEIEDLDAALVVRMLAVIVLVFMITWLPYRSMVVYNSLAKNRYVDLWFLLFCRTMVYINSAINPILYNAMSVKFRRAFKRVLSCGNTKSSVPLPGYSEVQTENVMIMKRRSVTSGNVKVQITFRASK